MQSEDCSEHSFECFLNEALVMLNRLLYYLRPPIRLVRENVRVLDAPPEDVWAVVKSHHVIRQHPISIRLGFR